MQIGLIGCGNMARALAAGGGGRVLCADPIAERAPQRWPRRSAGRRCRATPRWPSGRTWWCSATSPPSWRRWPRKSAAGAAPVASILAATPLAALREAYPGRPVYRFIPSLPVEVRQGAVVQAAGPDAAARAPDSAGSTRRSRELFAELGTLVVLDDALVDVAMGLMSCAPGLRGAGGRGAGRRGRAPRHPRRRRAPSWSCRRSPGTAELLRRRGYDTVAVRREVSSPGGLTARGLDALERGGLRAAFSDALDAVLGAGAR